MQQREKKSLCESFGHHFDKVNANHLVIYSRQIQELKRCECVGWNVLPDKRKVILKWFYDNFLRLDERKPQEETLKVFYSIWGSSIDVRNPLKGFQKEENWIYVYVKALTGVLNFMYGTTFELHLNYALPSHKIVDDFLRASASCQLLDGMDAFRKRTRRKKNWCRKWERG